MTDITWLHERLEEAYGSELTDSIWRGYEAARPVTLRVNSLKTDKRVAIARLTDESIACREIPWYEDALAVDNAQESRISETALFSNGEIYLQSLSSMLPPLFVEPQAEENILDMTAAPGGKTTQMSALSHGRAFITACERNPIRAQRLRYNVEKQGAPRVTVLTANALKLDEFFRFDKILLDAPCSGSGTLDLKQPLKISEKLVTNSVILQEMLLFKALKLLKKGGTLVYSTCSVLPCENTEIIEKAIKRGEAELVPVRDIADIPRLPSREGTLCVRPDDCFEGFFVAKLKKL